MKSGYKRTPTADEQELERKRREFHALERRLARLEHDLEDLREEIREFEKLYSVQMADRIRELDQLRQELARARSGAAARSRTGDGGERRHYGFQDDEPELEDIPRVKPGTAPTVKNEGIRNVYRRVAKAIHPDFAESDEDRRRRQKLMAEANRAYAEEDRVTLQAILEEWQLSPETAVAVGTAGELALVIRRIGRVVERIRGVELEMARLRNTDLYRLIQRVQDARWRGHDIIAEMASSLTPRFSPPAEPSTSWAADAMPMMPPRPLKHHRHRRRAPSAPSGFPPTVPSEPSSFANGIRGASSTGSASAKHSAPWPCRRERDCGSMCGKGPWPTWTSSAPSRSTTSSLLPLRHCRRRPDPHPAAHGYKRTLPVGRRNNQRRDSPSPGAEKPRTNLPLRHPGHRCRARLPQIPAAALLPHHQQRPGHRRGARPPAAGAPRLPGGDPPERQAGLRLPSRLITQSNRATEKATRQAHRVL